MTDANPDGAGDECRAATRPASASRRLLLSATAFFILGFAGTITYMSTLPSAIGATGLGSRATFGVWGGLVALLVGAAAAFAPVSIVRLRSIVSLGAEQPTFGRMFGWFATIAVVLAAILGGLILNSFTGQESTGNALNRRMWPISVLVGLGAMPSLAAFLAIRWIAADDRHWQEDIRCRVRLMRRTRLEIRWTLQTLGALLTLLVVTAGLRRRALLTFNAKLDEPIEGVLVYGLVFAVVLGSLHMFANNSISARADAMIDAEAPLPNPADENLGEQLQRREHIEALLGVTGALKSFEAGVVIAAPLLTALVGAATGG